jgi:hypothetical protein
LYLVNKAEKLESLHTTQPTIRRRGGGVGNNSLILANVNTPVDLILDRELLLQPFSIVTMLPEWAFPVQGRVIMFLLI